VNSMETSIIFREMRETKKRQARIKTAMDLLLLVVLIFFGYCFGLSATYVGLHRMIHPTTSMEWMAWRNTYFITGTVVGFGLLNRILRSTSFFVSIGSFPAIVIACMLSYFIGIVCLPGVLVWRVWTFVVAWRP
jgi:hypothetical protein